MSKKTENQPLATANDSATPPPTDNVSRPRFYIPSLDGIRAVSIAIVFLSHAGYTFIPGGFGVTVFFFLSGYLITTLLVKEFEANGTISLSKFYWRRVWRIFPPMYAALAFALVVSLVGLNEGTPTVTTVSLQALHLSNYVNISPELKLGMPLGSRVYWSLAVEEHFYLVFPILALFMLRRYTKKTQGIVIMILCAAVLAWRLILAWFFDASYDRLFFATDTRLDAILFGCAMGLYRNPMDQSSPQWSPRKAILWTGAAIIFILGTVLIRNELYRNTLRYTLQSAALLPIFYAAIQHPSVGPFRLLNLSWVRFIGLLSYSLYLVHQVIVLALRNMQPEISTPAVIVIAGTLSLALAYLFHILLELPAARMRKRYASIS